MKGTLNLGEWPWSEGTCDAVHLMDKLHWTLLHEPLTPERCDGMDWLDRATHRLLSQQAGLHLNKPR